MLIKRQVLRPAYYDRFSCIGGDCEDNCCKGWRITIDKNSYMQYKKIKNPEFAKKLSQRVRRQRGEGASELNYAAFVLDETTQACPFQTEDGLCEIQLEFGPKYLCATCQIYPRQIHALVPDMLECALTMSCPEAARLALLDRRPMEFLLNEMELDTGDAILQSCGTLSQSVVSPDRSTGYAWTLRDTCIDILQNRKNTLSERLLAVGMFLKKVSEMEQEGRSREIPRAAGIYGRAAATGQFSGAMDQFPENEAIQSAVTATLFGLMIAKREDYSPFAVVLDRFSALHGDLREQDGNTLAPRLYRFAEDCAGRQWDGLLAQYGHVLENYFVNFVFSTGFPFKHYMAGLTPYHHFIFLAEQYALFRIVLSCMAEEGTVGQTELIRTVTAMANLNQHFQGVTHVVDTYQRQGLDSLAHMAFLLR